jgi:asparagine synthase (glutamine-hydrolysing)
MSGLVMAYGEPNKGEIEAMLHKIKHRGAYACGTFKTNGLIMAQNYLEADGATPYKSLEIPVQSSSTPNLRICYDGQMGNWEDLARPHAISDGPFREERLFMALYQQFGKHMVQYLTDTIFAFVITDGDEIFAARDVLGIKTLYYGRKDHTLYLASELKSVLEVTDQVYEFPPGHFMDKHGNLTQFHQLPESQPEALHSDLNEITENIRSIIKRSVFNRVDFRVTTGSLLSGGIDSSVIACLASDVYRERFGKDIKLKTFALGVGESSDVKHARIMAEHIDSDHDELIVDLQEILFVLPEVIYYLESFDPSLVRSAVSNFLISRYAREKGIQVLLSGEGGDEVFCGYTYLKDFPFEEQFSRQVECLGFLHNNAALRLDRMNACHGVRVVAPLISGELLDYALAIPPEYKQRPESGGRIEKWVFRKAFESYMPEEIVWRFKQEFSQGSGAADLLPAHFEHVISDNELAEAQARHPIIRSKEELYYFRVFAEHFGIGKATETVGQWISL